MFAIKGKEKFNGIFTPQKNSFADYYDLMKAWVADFGPDCIIPSEGVGLGSIVYLKDAFELTPLPRLVAETYSKIVDFGDDIAAEINDTGGHALACVVHESALMGVEESTCQTNPKLSWGLPNSELPSSSETSASSPLAL